MHASLKWVDTHKCTRGFFFQVTDHEHCDTCRKHIKFGVDGDTIEILTDEKGLQTIAKAIADHPNQMKFQALGKFRKELQRLKESGIDTSEITPELVEKKFKEGE